MFILTAAQCTKVVCQSVTRRKKKKKKKRQIRIRKISFDFNFELLIPYLHCEQTIIPRRAGGGGGGGVFLAPVHFPDRLHSSM